MGLILFMRSLNHFGSCLFLRMFAHVESVFLLCGLACLDFCLLVLDHALMGFSISTRSCAQAGLASLAPDFLHLGPFMLPRSLS